MKLKTLVRGPALSQSGYGEHARFVLRALRSQEDLFDIYLDNLSWGHTSWLWEDTEERRWIDSLLMKTTSHRQQNGTFDISLQVTIPNEWEKLAPINIGCTAGIETTKISPQWVEKSYLMDRIIVVSNFSKEAFVKTVYEAQNPETGEVKNMSAKGPITVVNYPFRPTIPSNVDFDLKYDFNFLSVAQWSPRKNIENTVRWFIEEFYDQEVGLVLKTSLANNSYIDATNTKNNIKSLLADPKYSDRKCAIHFLHGYLKDNEMAALYQHPKIKALINIAHGEGFGLPMFEMAGCGKPVVAVGWGGQTDFLYAPEKVKGKKKKQLMPKFAEVDFQIAHIQENAVWEGVLQKDSQWAYADQGSFKMKLRDVYKKYRIYENRAKDLQKHIVNNFSEKAQYLSFCESVLGEKIIPFEVEDLPKISILTSVYDGDEFIESFLEDITRQTIFEDKCELILVNANSPGTEEEVINRYLDKYPQNIKYFKLDEDPGIYGTWNYALEQATGEYITNANLDDRKAHNSLERHARELLQNKEVSLVYADSLITNKPNELFEENSAQGRKYNFEQFSKEAMLRGNQPHNNPMWRKILHEEHGAFNNEYKSAGDWEFFLRCAFGGATFKKIDGVFGLYYFNPKGISTNFENFSWKQEEEKQIYNKYKALLEQ